MKNANAALKKLRGLIKSTGSADPPGDAAAPPDPVTMLVKSFLMWESTTEKAEVAFRKLEEAVVDFNDLRVSMPAETVDIIGQRYPLAHDRAHRLRAALRDVYLREHAICLDRLHGFGKREVRKYLESIDGIVPYVSARVSLLSFGAHAIPVDEQLRARLLAESIIEEGMDVAEVASWLTRHLKATEGVEAHQGLQALVDKGAARPRRKTAANGKGPVRKTTRKKKKTTSRRDATRKSTRGSAGRAR